MDSQKKDWWGWWYFALFPLVVLVFLFFVGTILPIIVQSYRTDGKLVIDIGVLGPIWLWALIGKLLPSKDKSENRAWSTGTLFMIWFSVLFLVAQWLFSLGLLPNLFIR